MNLSLPFYDKKGTIKKIVEHDRFYEVHRYGTNRKEDTIFNVPKNFNNYKMLLENYYSDLKEYLIKYQNKYECYKMSRLKKKINMDVVGIIKSLAIIGFATSVPLLLTGNSLVNLGIILDIIAVPMFITSTNLTLKNNNNKKKSKFIEQYNNLVQQLNIYNNDKIRIKNKTEYKGLPNINTKEPIYDINKTLKKVA